MNRYDDPNHRDNALTHSVTGAGVALVVSPLTSSLLALLMVTFFLALAIELFQIIFKNESIDLVDRGMDILEYLLGSIIMFMIIWALER